MLAGAGPWLAGLQQQRIGWGMNYGCCAEKWAKKVAFYISFHPGEIFLCAYAESPQLLTALGGQGHQTFFHCLHEPWRQLSLGQPSEMLVASERFTSFSSPLIKQFHCMTGLSSLGDRRNYHLPNECEVLIAPFLSTHCSEGTCSSLGFYLHRAAGRIAGQSQSLGNGLPSPLPILSNRSVIGARRIPSPLGKSSFSRVRKALLDKRRCWGEAEPVQASQALSSVFLY